MSLPRIVDIREETTPPKGLAEVDEGKLSSSIFEKVGEVCNEIEEKLKFYLVKHRRYSLRGGLLLFWEGGELPPLGFSVDDQKIVELGEGLVRTESREIIGTYESIYSSPLEERCMLILLF